MIEKDPTTNDVAPDSKAPGVSADANRQQAFVFTILGLLLGVIALGLASIPAIALDRPAPHPFAEQEQEEKEEPVAEPPAEREGGVTLRYKNFSFNLGGKAPEPESEPLPEPEPEAAPPPTITSDPIRWFTIAAIACALVGLVISAVGQLRERHTVITVGSMGCCAAAITWQYVAVGISIGVAAAVFLVVLAVILRSVASN